MIWVLGALCIGAPVLVMAAYLLTLNEIDEILNDSQRQTALLLADRDLRGAIAPDGGAGALTFADTESKLVAIARRLDGALLFTSEPSLSLRFVATPGMSLQRANDADWHVFTVVQGDRIVQVAQPDAARREVAAESASQLVVPLLAWIMLIGALLVMALRRGMKPLAVANEALSQRNARSLEPLALDDVPIEILPVVRTLNDLLQRLGRAFDAQQHFVSHAAHELRSPITALQLQVQVLERTRDSTQRIAATAELAEGIARARRLIEQLLQLSRASSERATADDGTSETVRLGDIARSVVVRHERDAEARGIDLGADVTSSVSIQGHPAQLEIMLGNLVENALRYAGQGARVDVVAGELDGHPALRVIDNGPGIAASERGKVFDRFYRSPEAVASSEPGSGLGLAIVKTIADRHGAVVLLNDGPDGVGLDVSVVFTEVD